MKKLVLGIETSCDDTSIALLESKGLNDSPKLLAHLAFSQTEILKKWGGVVPEISSRAHVDKITPLLKEAFEMARCSIAEVDLIGVTAYPGLLGPLLVGLSTAKTLSLIHKIPIYPVNHLYAHLEAIHLTEAITYPYLGLLVSGGHSQYFLVEAKDRFRLIGQTLDDAAGEAFDKGGKLLGLGYPAGQIIDQLAAQGNPDFHKFPIGLSSKKTPNLSFSGLKADLLRYVQDNKLTPPIEDITLKNICASYQKAIVLALTSKLKIAYNQACESINIGKLPIVVGGGVACNSELRKSVIGQFPHAKFVAPKFCTDNGAMIANYAARMFDRKVGFPQCLEIDAQSRFTPEIFS